jgi:hypothetical protein
MYFKYVLTPVSVRTFLSETGDSFDFAKKIENLKKRKKYIFLLNNILTICLGLIKEEETDKDSKSIVNMALSDFKFEKNGTKFTADFEHRG